MTAYTAKFKNGRVEELESKEELDDFLRHFDIEEISQRDFLSRKHLMMFSLETEIAYVSVKSDSK